MLRVQVIEALGVNVVTVPRLSKKALLIDDHDVALIRNDLNPADQDRVLDWLLDGALRRTIERSRDQHRHAQ